MKHFTKQQLKYYAILALAISFVMGSFFFSDLIFLDEIVNGGGFRDFLMATAMLFGVAGLLFLFLFLKWRLTRYSVDEESVVLKKFMFGKRVVLKYVNIQGIDKRQNFLQKLLKIQSIVIEGLNTYKKKELLIVVVGEKEATKLMKIVQANMVE